MKRSFSFLFIMLMILGTQAQITSVAGQSGMDFVHNTSWQKVLDKAKAENKFIFVDCYTTWCGPCKRMSASVFPMQEVGSFYNAHYVNVKAQMDSSSNDNEEIKAGYADYHVIQTKYDIKAYPTYLVFNPSGELVQRFVGSMSPEEFIAKGKDALIPEKQYYTQLARFQAGERSPAYLYQMSVLCMDAYDKKAGPVVFNEYVKTKPDLYKKENLDMVVAFTQSSSDTGFAMMMQSPDKVDSIAGEKISVATVKNIIVKEELVPVLFSKPAESGAAKPDWAVLQSKLEKKYPVYAKEIIAGAQVNYYQFNKQWDNYGSAVVTYLNNYGEKLPAFKLNEYAWNVFEHCNDKATLSNVLEWSKKSFASDNNYACMDTYANLLMKLGKKSEAIEWETKANTLAKQANDPDIATYEKTLNDMKGGQM